jgi:signal transduction histidine kinase
MNTDLAVQPTRVTGDEHAGQLRRGPWSGLAAAASRLAAGVARRWERPPLGWRCAAVGLLGAAAAAGVAYVTAENHAAAPAHIAVELRVFIIGGYIAGGIYAQTSRIQARMGALLIAAGLFSSLWLLNGSTNRFAFTVGVVCASAMPTIVAYVILAHPTGHVPEKRFLWITGGVLAASWLLSAVIAVQPPLKTPLVTCAPHCSVHGALWPSISGVVPVLTAVAVLSWLTLTIGTPILVTRRARSSSAPVRHSLVPVWIAALVFAASLVAYLVLLVVWPRAAPTVGAVYIAIGGVVPLAILSGLSRERMFMGQTLAELVNELARHPQADTEALISAALRDPSLRIAYCRPESGTYVDSAGKRIDELPADRAVTWIERDRRRVAAVMYNPELRGLERFVRAIASAALIRLENAQTEADLKASTTELAASRGRLVEMAHAERRRLERDLHDGVQQGLVGLRIKLDLAAETIKQDPAQGEQVLASMGRQMDDLLQEIRMLARGIYPSLLSARGVVEALRAAGRSSPSPVEVRSRSVGRYAEEIEVAVYFCCLEALQNVTKHAGPHAAASVVLREEDELLGFEVRDSGLGFDPQGISQGTGLVNMHDRMEAVGGWLEVLSRRGRGTSIRGYVPLA